MVELTTVLLLTAVAFAGGAFGAALGALPSLAFAGFIVIAGEIMNIGSDVVAGGGGALGAYGITGSIAFGAGFGPHVAFAGGAAATAYAARRGKMNTGFDYHEAKNITYSLGPDPDVLLVGGAFGAAGYLLFYLSNTTLGLPVDPVAVSIVLTGFLHRIAFGYPLVGAAPEGLLNMTPFERDQRRAPVADGGERGAQSPDSPSVGSAPADGSRVSSDRSDGAASDVQTGGIDPARAVPGDRRLLVEPWLPHQYKWPSVAFLGAVVGVFSAYVAWITASPFLGFGITAASLLVLALGMERFPVTHHMALPAGLLVVALAPGVSGPGIAPAQVQANVSLWLVVVGGAAMGLVAGLAGELCQRVLYAHADTHLDPPAASIVLTTLLIALLDIAGLFQQSFVPTLGL
ncbi:MAG: hypothetical protein ABEJ05_02040 [Haloglomus sp.]